MIPLRGAARWAGLAVRLLRYRVAVMLWLFLLLGAAHHGRIADAGWRLVAAAVTLGAAYVAATAINDLADREIDAINHPRDRGRPLVTGEATPREALLLHAGSAIAAVAAAGFLGIGGVALAVTSVLLGQLYSLPPIRVSYRTYLAPLLLAVAYVAIPYVLGVVAMRAWLTPGDGPFVAALLLLFLARIVLKDFRDRPGDARYGKPTLLLRFGPGVTCAVSLAALVAGNVLLMAAVGPPLPIAVVLEVSFLAIVSRLRALSRAGDVREEQLAIGLGARMGNGILLSALGWMMLRAEGATTGESLTLVVLITAAAWAGFVAGVRDPGRVAIAYKG
ncbi:MAG: UbiA family prenyltransferase [Actinomycetota bacterium]